jgi:predicted DNA-binding WGR domain protein
MANVNIQKIGHFFSETDYSDSDKIWGYADVNGTLFSFWGRRGQTLSYQEIPGPQAAAKAEKKWREKRAKGYDDVTDRTERVIPGAMDYIVTYLIDALVDGKVTKAKWAMK